jgi:hypothetical protein
LTRPVDVTDLRASVSSNVTAGRSLSSAPAAGRTAAGPGPCRRAVARPSSFCVNRVSGSWVPSLRVKPPVARPMSRRTAGTGPAYNLSSSCGNSLRLAVTRGRRTLRGGGREGPGQRIRTRANRVRVQVHTCAHWCHRDCDLDRGRGRDRDRDRDSN